MGRKPLRGMRPCPRRGKNYCRLCRVGVSGAGRRPIPGDGNVPTLDPIRPGKAGDFYLGMGMPIRERTFSCPACGHLNSYRSDKCELNKEGRLAPA